MNALIVFERMQEYCRILARRQNLRNKRVLIETDPYTSIAANIPKKLIRNYSDILTLVTTTQRIIPSDLY